MLAGVAGVLSDSVGVSPTAARAALVALSFFGGSGIVIYVAVWLMVPPAGSDEPVVRGAMGDRRTISLVTAVASALVVALVVASVLKTPALIGDVSPGVVALAGLVVVWRHAGPEDRQAAARLASLLSGAGPAAVPTRRRLLVASVRLLAGVALIAGGTSAVLAPKHLTEADFAAAAGALGVVAGFALVLAPWWLRLGRDLASERRERARAEERAEMAAHLHDSVLQTLALIQRSAADPHQVQRLARAQERQLRSWLFDAIPGQRDGLGPASVSGALLSLQQEVETDHGVRVELVTVGDAPLDEASKALLAAAREAAVNSAKWSGADVVSIYAEAEPTALSVFVRDRGRGFDPAEVAADRKGISESIHARVRRCGGTSSVRSSPGQGTEVALKVERTAPR
jgi:signal transduction histidine kinase/phage shock protein PspC (stress-responsive transcriptional regulator)